MNNQPHPIMETQLRLLRITLELQSPLSLGSGDAHSIFDSPCAVDANGLPCLPGTSLAGAIRAWWTQNLDPEHHCVDTWFGMVPLRESDLLAASRSRMTFSLGHIHDAKDRPVDEWKDPDQLHQDPILSPLLGSNAPVREHVRLNARGAAADTAKYDRSQVPAGHRFTFQIQLRLRPDNVKTWEDIKTKLLAAFKNGAISLGGANRSGLGRVHAIAAHELVVFLPRDIQKISEHQKLSSKLPASTAQPLTAPKEQRPTTTNTAHAPAKQLNLSIELHALDLWRVGSSGVEPPTPSANGHAPDTQPLSEHHIDWRSDKIAKIKHRKVVPGSGIKGALAHRAVFHYNRLTQRWADQAGEQAPLNALPALFGQALNDTEGRAGYVHVSDSTLLPTVPARAALTPHVRIDRFTGGAWNGALFNESLVLRGGIQLQIRLELDRLSRSPHAAADELKALAMAITDLGEGRLSLGAGAARGLGRFKFAYPELALSAIQQLNTVAQPDTQHHD